MLSDYTWNGMHNWIPGNKSHLDIWFRICLSALASVRVLMQDFFSACFFFLCRPVCSHITATEPRKCFHDILELRYLTKMLLMLLSIQLDQTVLTPHYLTTYTYLCTRGCSYFCSAHEHSHLHFAHVRWDPWPAHICSFFHGKLWSCW